MKCIVCKKKYDNKKANYGWHINRKTKLLEHCCFPMQLTTGKMKLPNPLPLPGARFINEKKGT